MKRLARQPSDQLAGHSALSVRKLGRVLRAVPR